MLLKLEIIFNFENNTITLQEVSISIKPPNCTAKGFFVIKESHTVQKTSERLN